MDLRGALAAALDSPARDDRARLGRVDDLTSRGIDAARPLPAARGASRRTSDARSATGPVRTAAHRSPTAASRPGIVRIVKSRRSTPLSTSSHVSGADAPAYSLARALYAVASVFARMFCK